MELDEGTTTERAVGLAEGLAQEGAAEWDPFPVGRLLVRARRLRDLSQRDLARLSGVPQSRIAALESGTGSMSVERVDALFAAMGLHLTVVEANGQPLEPAQSDLVRDNAGRRFPAHLDVDPPDEEPVGVYTTPRYDRRARRARYYHRDRRDELRSRGIASPPRHPTEHELWVRSEWRARCVVRRVVNVPWPEVECSCPLECYDSWGCVEACACQCEPPLPSLWPRSA